MKKQQTFTDTEYSCRKKKTRREEFLEIMDEIIPWDEWVGIIEPYYPNGKRGRPPMGIEKMLRMYLLQIWSSLSDPAAEDAIYDMVIPVILVFKSARSLETTRIYPESTTVSTAVRTAFRRFPTTPLIGAFYRTSQILGAMQSGHVFRIIKCQFGYTKTRYGGLMKNGNRLYAMFACANLYMLAMAGRSLRED